MCKQKDVTINLGVLQAEETRSAGAFTGEKRIKDTFRIPPSITRCACALLRTGSKRGFRRIQVSDVAEKRPTDIK